VPLDWRLKEHPVLPWTRWRAAQKLKQLAAERALDYLSALLKASALERQEEEELNYAGYPKWHPGTVGMARPDSPLVRALGEQESDHTGRQGLVDCGYVC
jgi:hypothetical protein